MGGVGVERRPTTATDSATTTGTAATGTGQGGPGGQQGAPNLGEIESKLAAARKALADPSVPLSDDEKSQLAAAIAQAQGRLDAYKSLQGQGSTRNAAMGTLAVGAGAVVADDATGVGVADDPLLILIGLAALAVLVATRPPASSGDLQAAWDALASSVRTVAQLGTGLIALKLNGDKIRGNTGQLAAHLARLLGRGSVGGVPSGEPPGNGQDDNHWWKEIKAFLKNIRDGIGDGSRKQVMRELLKRFTPEQIAEIEKALVEAAKKMGEPPPPFLP